MSNYKTPLKFTSTNQMRNIQSIQSSLNKFSSHSSSASKQSVNGLSFKPSSAQNLQSSRLIRKHLTFDMTNQSFNFQTIGERSSMVKSSFQQPSEESSRVTNLEQEFQFMRQEMKHNEDKWDTKFSGLENKLDTKFARVEKKWDTKFSLIEKKWDTKFSLIEENMNQLRDLMKTLVQQNERPQRTESSSRQVTEPPHSRPTTSIGMKRPFRWISQDKKATFLPHILPPYRR